MNTTQQDTVELLENRLRRNPDSLRFSRLADEYRKQGDVQRAISICTQGLEKHPWYATGRLILGRCYLEQENYAKAIEEFTRVCQQDRGNHVAMKMLADVYAKQGMTEKAGDLYALLARSDPDNASLAHLASENKGSGKKDVFAILGVEPTPPSQTPPPPSSPSPAADSAPEQITTEQPQSHEEQFEPTPEPITLEAPQESGTFSLEETVDDIGSDTGESWDDDISARMAMMFDEEGSIVEPPPQESTPPSEVEQLVPTDQQPSPADQPASEPQAEIGGTDISARIEELFGNEEPAAATQQPRAEGPPSPGQPAMPPPEPSAPPPAQPAAGQPVEEPAPPTTPPDQDISDRLEGLFAEEQAQTQQQTPSPEFTPAEPVDTSQVQDTKQPPQAGQEAMPPETGSPDTEQFDPFADLAAPEQEPQATTPEQPADFTTQEPAQADTAPPAEEQPEPVPAQEQQPPPPETAPRQDTGTVQPPEDAAPVPPAEQEAPAAEPEQAPQPQEPAIEGADISSRLDEIFAEENDGQPAQPENETREQPRSADPTGTADSVETIGSLEAAHPPQSTETPPPEQAEQPAAETPPTEEPHVSGTDISSRLDEIFTEEPRSAGQEENAPDDFLGLSDEWTTDTDEPHVDQSEQEGVSGELQQDTTTEPQPPAAEAETGDTIDNDALTFQETDTGEQPPREVAADAGPVDAATEHEQHTEPGTPAAGIETAGTATDDSPSPKDTAEPHAPPPAEQESVAEQTTAGEPRKEEPANELDELCTLAEDILSLEETLDEVPDEDDGEDSLQEFYDIEGDTVQDQSGDEDTMAAVETLDTIEAEPAAQTPPAEEPPAIGHADTEDQSENQETASPPQPETVFDQVADEDLLAADTDENIVPDEDDEEETVAEEYYTVSGENAQEEGAPAADLKALDDLGDLEIQTTMEDETESEPEQAADMPVEQPEVESVAENRETAPENTSTAPEDTPAGDETVPPGDLLAEDIASPTEELPDDDTEDESTVEDFYTISGESAEKETADVPELEAVGAVEIEQSDTDPAREESESQAQAATPAADTQQEETTGESSAAAYAIPDHVLTPTLADIYYQQGQPQLAVQVYQRLLERDPDNEKFQQRIDRIRQEISAQAETAASEPEAPARKTKSTRNKTGSSSRKKRGRKSGEGKPLAGVRIKKKYKERLRKRR